MSERLSGALRALADSAEPPTQDPLLAGRGAWRAAASHRRRRRLAVAAGAAVALVVVALSIASINPMAGPVPPAGQPLPAGEGLPAELYTVQPWLPTIGADPIPPVAYVVEQSDLPRPVAISVDGSYRYLPDPPDVEGYAMSSYAVSPDGRRIAVAWSVPRGSDRQLTTHAEVVAYDVTTGERLGPWLGQGFGSAITQLAWKPDGQGLAWEEFRVDDEEADGSSGTSVAVVFDWSTGDRRDLPGYVGPFAWSPTGDRVVAWSNDWGLSVVPLAGGKAVVLDLPFAATSGPIAWSPDGRSVATVAPCGALTDSPAGAFSCNLYEGSQLAVSDAATGTTTLSPLAGLSVDGAVLGWRSGRPVRGGGDDVPDDGTGRWPPYIVRGVEEVGQDQVALTTTPDERVILVGQAAQSILANAPVVDVAAPHQPSYSWAALQWRLAAHRTGVIVAVVVIGLVVLFARAVTRRRSRRPALPR